MRYEGSIYRPPSEAYSLIIQATVGCSHNRCTFCSMYKEKTFRMREVDEVLEDISLASRENRQWERVFLADGDALIMPMNKLIAILEHIQKELPHCNRVGIYASEQSLRTKTIDELKLLKEKGLGIAYLGVESGSDTVLNMIAKGTDSLGFEEASLKIKAADIVLSVMLISGIGGKKHTMIHAIESARLMQRIQPDYLSLLTLMVDSNTTLAEQIRSGEFELLNSSEVLEETLTFLENLGETKTIFRCNHASNYLNLAGTLPEDRKLLISYVQKALVEGKQLKSEYFRRL